jgi:hypothetical protein
MKLGRRWADQSSTVAAADFSPQRRRVGSALGRAGPFRASRCGESHSEASEVPEEAEEAEDFQMIGMRCRGDITLTRWGSLG